MRTPYYHVTAKCKYAWCDTDEFTVDRKTVVKKSISEQPYTITSVVCPNCRTWAPIVRIKEVR